MLMSELRGLKTKREEAGQKRTNTFPGAAQYQASVPLLLKVAHTWQ